MRVAVHKRAGQNTFRRAAGHVTRQDVQIGVTQIAEEIALLVAHAGREEIPVIGRDNVVRVAVGIRRAVKMCIRDRGATVPACPCQSDKEE